MKSLLKTSVAGIALGLFLTFFPLGFVVALAFFLCIYIIRVKSAPLSKGFLLKLFIAAFIIRAALAVLNYNFGLIGVYKGADTQPDAVIYNSNAFFIAHVLKGEVYEPGEDFKEPFITDSMFENYEIYKGFLPQFGIYQYNLFVYLIGFIYYLFGYSPVAVKLLNCLIGSLIPVLTFVIAKYVFRSDATARWSAIITMLFPSIVFWSVTLLKDTLVEFLFILAIFSALKFFKEDNKAYFLAYLVIILILGFLKEHIRPILIGVILLMVLIKAVQKVWQKTILTRIVSIVIASMLLVSVIALKHSAIKGTIENGLFSLFNYQKTSVVCYPTAASFKLYKDYVYQTDRGIEISDFLDISIVFSMVKGLFYYFFSPFPWFVPYNHFGLLFFYPQSIFMLLSIPFMLIGIVGGLRTNTSVAALLIIILAFLAVPQAMAEGVIGNVVRHRDIFTPFLIIFIVQGLRMVFFSKERANKYSA